MKFILLNKGDANIKNIIDHINNVLSKHKPHFLVLNELQKHVHDTTSQNQFPGYTLEYDSLDKLDGWARTGILVKKNIIYKRRRDLESPGISTVWLQVGTQAKKHFLLHGLYRQFQRPGNKGTSSHPSQYERWKQILTNWETAQKEDREIITLGDCNIDSIPWENRWEDIPETEKPKQKLYNLLKEKILSHGTVKINSEYTREGDQPAGRKACLDHAYTSNPEKINSHTTYHATISDHSMIEINKNCKNIKNKNNFLKIRSMKIFDRNVFIENIKNHGNFVEILYERDLDIIVEKFTQMLQDSLEPIAPVTRIQLSSKNVCSLSETAREALANRDTAHQEAKDNPTIENHCNFTYKRNEANIIIAQERFERKKAIFQNEKSIKSKWSLVKEETGQKQQTAPKVIIEGSIVHTKPKDMANALNRVPEGSGRYFYASSSKKDCTAQNQIDDLQQPRPTIL